VSPVRYELCLYIPEDGILHSLGRGNLTSYINILHIRRHKEIRLSQM
jgi:hypothetical protein